MRTFPLDHLVKAAPRLVEKGFRQMKTQLALPGDTSPAIEVDRIRKMRESIGPNIDLMCDINQRWRVEQAIDIGTRIEDVRPVLAGGRHDGRRLPGTRPGRPTRWRRRLRGGEYLYGPAPLRQMMEARSVDIVMIDLMRAGGITGWLKIAGMAEAFNLPVVSHLVPEIHVHLIAAIPNGLTVEYMPWTFSAVRGSAAAGEGRARGAEQARARPQVRRGGAEALRGIRAIGTGSKDD